MRSIYTTNRRSAIVEIVRRLRRFNAETQRFAEGRREERKNRAFSSAFLRALCVFALRLVRFRLWLCRAVFSAVNPVVVVSSMQGSALPALNATASNCLEALQRVGHCPGSQT